ncbi:hypothetical protein KFU94_44415 [Chloroflexi bacterium TSY]|nr:hypothetical protein [Chloroflexi bacterium TSY]
MPETVATTQQWALIQRWMDSVQQIPEVDAAWIEGSLASDRGNPSSDIDMRFAIADEAYERLWGNDRTAVLAGLGEYYLLETRFIRALTDSGIIVELWSHRTSQVENLELFEWELLFSRLPNGRPHFRQLPPKSPAETWPDSTELTPAVVSDLANLAILFMAHAPATLYNNEIQSARSGLDRARNEMLLKILYRRSGLWYSKRYKHFTEIFPQEWLDDFASTYMKSADPFDPTAIAQAYIRLHEVIGKHLQALSDTAGGGFDAIWYERVFKKVEREFLEF